MCMQTPGRAGDVQEDVPAQSTYAGFYRLYCTGRKCSANQDISPVVSEAHPLGYFHAYSSYAEYTRWSSVMMSSQVMPSVPGMGSSRLTVLMRLDCLRCSLPIALRMAAQAMVVNS